MSIFFPRLAGTLLLLLGVAGATEAAAQGAPGLPACTPGAIEQAPCRASYETAPVLAEVPAQAVAAGEQRMPQVWMLVDATGAVRVAQVERSAGTEWDEAAVERARHFRYQPAMQGGQPTPAWVLLSVPAVPRPPSCGESDAAVPLRTGVAIVADSSASESPGAGTRYRYRSVAEFDLDVLIQPAADGSPEARVEQAILALRSGGDADSVAVLSRGRERVRLHANGGGGVTTGHAARLRVWSGGGAAESYVGVFPTGGGSVTIRGTYPPGEEGRVVTTEFVRQLLSHRGWVERGCPRS